MPEYVLNVAGFLKLAELRFAVSDHCILSVLALLLCLPRPAPTPLGNQLATVCLVVSVPPLPVFTSAVGTMLQHCHSRQVMWDRL